MATAATKSANTIARLRAMLSERVVRTLELAAEKNARDPLEHFTLEPMNPVRVLLAYSGGRDSTALADILARLYHKPHQGLISSLKVVHIHHGLSQNADAWVEHARASCEKWNLPLITERVFVSRASGLGIEGAAREARYRALARIAREENASVILTAHHLDDRLETFLIQWMRGAGPEGLAAMSEVRPIESADPGSGTVLARPWLDVPREAIEAYCTKARLCWVEDDSNSDTHFLRNLIRAEIFPQLDKARSGWRQAAARSIGLVAQSAAVARGIGEEDAVRCQSPDNGRALVIAKLLALPLARQSLCLRSWLAAQGVRAPSKVRLDDTLRQVRETHNDSRLRIRIDGHEIRRWGANLVLCAVKPQPREAVRDMELCWTGEGELPLPYWNGVLKFIPCEENEDGFDAELLKKGRLEARARKGGEKIKLHRLRPSRNLKHLYQQDKIPAFERGGLPLVWLDGELIYAARLGAEVRALADRDLVKNRVRLEWVPDTPLLGL
jgi:tRNA(Ile)-lysidine synthase